MHGRLLRLVAGGLGIVLVGSLVTASPVEAASGRKALPGSVPAWANARNLVAHAPGSNYLGFRVYLGWRDAAGLEALLRAQQTPGSKSYRKFLTPAEFVTRFAPAQADVDAVVAWLRGSGLTVGSVPANRHYVQAEGPVSRIEKTFATRLNLYRVRGVQLRSPAADVSVPSSVARAVAGVVGLDESAYFAHPNTYDALPPSPTGSAGTCGAYFGQKTSETDPPADAADLAALPDSYERAPDGGVPWAACGYGPGQVQHAYGLDEAYANGVTGTGVTIAVIDAYASPTAARDLAQFSANHGLPAPDLTELVAPGTYRHPEQGKKQDPQGWYVEESLDLAAVHSAAPGAKIVYVGAANHVRDLDAAMNHVVSRRLADVVSNSYSFPSEMLPRGFIKPYEQTLMQAAAQGMTILFDSGDNGDESIAFGAPVAEYPSTSPWVTTVGGTSLIVGAGVGARDAGNALQPETATPVDGTYGIAGFAGGRGETGWGTGVSAWNWADGSNPFDNCAGTAGTWCPAPPGSFYGGAGGGTSLLFARPWWQTAVPGLPAGAARVEPDVAMNADPNTGDLFGETFSVGGKPVYLELRIGGTSLATPLFAGAVALAVQRAGKPLGFLNPTIYTKHDAFRDVGSSRIGGLPTIAVLRTSAGRTTLRSFDLDTSLATGIGWDSVTGVGSVDGWSWVKAIAGR